MDIFCTTHLVWEALAPSVEPDSRHRHPKEKVSELVDSQLHIVKRELHPARFMRLQSIIHFIAHLFKSFTFLAQVVVLENALNLGIFVYEVGAVDFLDEVLQDFRLFALNDVANSSPVHMSLLERGR